MFLQFGVTMQLKTRYIQKRGSTYQFVLRIPADLKERYGKQFIRTSLQTKDLAEAIKLAEPLARKYQQEFDRLRKDAELTPRDVFSSAKEMAESWGNLADFIEYFMEPKWHQSFGRYNDCVRSFSETPPEEYMSPLELEAGKILREGLDTVRLSDALDLYLKTHKRAEDVSFVKTTNRHWEKLVSFLGDVPVVSLTRAHARDYSDHLLKGGAKTGTVRRNLTQVKAILNAAIREAELTKQNPFSHLGISGEGQDAEKTPVPTKETLQNIVEAFNADNSPVALLSLLLVETGSRIGEFSGMKTSDVFLDAPIPYVRVKPNEWRSVKTESSIREFPLVGASLDAMKKLLAQPRDNDALFPNYAKERGQDAASAAVNRRLEKWGITSHSFRHALKDRLREIGCPKDIRDAIQGHENGDVAESYGLGHTLQTMQEWLLKSCIPLPEKATSSEQT